MRSRGGDYIWKVTKVNWKTHGPRTSTGSDLRKIDTRRQTFPLHVHLLEQVASDRLDGLQTQPLDVGGGVVSAQRRQVDQGDGLEQPGRLRESRQAVTPSPLRSLWVGRRAAGREAPTCQRSFGILRAWRCRALPRTACVFTLAFEIHSRSGRQQERKGGLLRRSLNASSRAFRFMLKVGCFFLG